MDAAIRLGITGETADAIRVLARRGAMTPEDVARALLETGLRDVSRALGAPSAQPVAAGVIDWTRKLAERRQTVLEAVFLGGDYE